MSGRVRAAVAAFVLALAMGAGLTAGAAGAGETGGSEAQTKMRMSVTAERFVVRGNRVYARGPVALRTNGSGDIRHQTERRVGLKLRRKGGKCTVLDLHLAELFVALLGLEVRTSEVNVEITGTQKKVLGRLFCKLSKGLNLGRKRVAKEAARSLNRQLEDRPMRLLRVNATLHAQTFAGRVNARAPGDGGPRCQILDVDIGPLELDLLGLMVDLYGPNRNAPIHVDADADPNGGAVGASLCELSAGPQA